MAASLSMAAGPSATPNRGGLIANGFSMGEAVANYRRVVKNMGAAYAENLALARQGFKRRLAADRGRQR